MKRELPIPDKADTAEQAIEVLRAWIIDDALHCSLFPKAWRDEPEMWGRFFADLLELISNAVAEETGLGQSELIARIQAAFAEEAAKIPA